MSTQPRNLLSPEEYLVIERAAEYKSEYHDGEMFAMSGASRQHSILAVNLITALNNELPERCTVFDSDMRVKLPTGRTFVYPDASVACDEPEFLDRTVDTLVNPTAVFEILSPSTEAYDRGLKSGNYRKIASLHTYVLIAQDCFHVEVFTKNSEGVWMLTEAEGADAEVEIPGLSFRVRMEQLYRRVKFE